METNVRKSGRMLHRACAIALAGALSFGAVGSLYAEPPAVAAVEQTQKGVNLALEATAKASGQEDASHGAKNANDGNMSTRWSSGTACPQKDTNTWIELDFKKPTAVQQINVMFETREKCDPVPSNVKGFDIQVKESDGGDWKTIATVANQPVGDGYATTIQKPLEEKKTVTAIRLTNFDVKDGSTQWNGVSVRELECFADVQVADANNVNHAKGAKATASVEDSAHGFTANKVNDGKTGKDDRWCTGDSKPAEGNATWLQLDFPQPTKVKQLNIDFENRTAAPMPSNVEKFDIQCRVKGSNEWKTVSTVTNKAQGDGFATHVEAKLNEPVVADSIRLTNFKIKSGSTAWNGLSIVEMSVFSNDRVAQTQTIDEVLAGLQGGTIELGKDKIDTPQVSQGFEIKFNGCDFEQVIGKDGNVHHPLTDKQVKVSWEIKDLNTGTTKVSSDLDVTVKGTKSTAAKAGANAKPQVVPEIQEWWAENGGKLSLAAITKATYTDASLKPIVEEFVADYEAFTGKKLAASQGEAQANAINFKKGNPENDAMLGDEGYRMVIDADSIDITAPAVTGNMYGAQTILQMTKLYEDKQFPQGEMRDYPRFPVRGFMWDVARKPVSLDMMKTVARTMRYYKMNDFQTHLSDNLIFLENYKSDDEALEKAYAAFRLESGVENPKTGETATAKDYFITKEDFRKFIQEQRALGMNIVPEIDMPAHAVAFTRAFPELAVMDQTVTTSSKDRWAVDHLDLRNPQTMPLIKAIFDDYTTGANETFDDETTVHIGADEFIIPNGRPQYCDFYNQLVPHLQKNGNTPRVWGSFDSAWLAGGGTEPTDGSEACTGVEMDIWSLGWANPERMFNKGFSLINILDSYGYMVPNGGNGRGAYGDRLNTNSLYKNFDPANFGGRVLPSSDSQIMGAEFAIWNDNIDTNACGLTEADEFERFFDAMPVYAENNWAPTGMEKGEDDAGHKKLYDLVDKLGVGPRVNPYSEVSKTGDTYADYDFEGNLEDSSKNDRDLKDGEGAKVANGALELAGGASYVESPLNKIAAGTELSFDIELTEPAAPGDILFEADAPYGTLDIRVMDNGKLGFTRELYDYYFDYVLPVGKKVNVTIKTKAIDTHTEETVLFVDGEEIGKATGRFFDHGMVKKEGIDNATLTIPLQRIGSKTNAIAARIDNVEVKPTTTVPVVDEFNKAAWKGTTNSQTLTGEGNGGHIEHAFDGDPATIWHSNWQNATDDNKNGLLTVTNPISAEIDLGKAYDINQFSFTPRKDVDSGRVIQASLYVKANESDEWTRVADKVTFKGDGSKKSFNFDTQKVRYVKFEAYDSKVDGSNKKWVAVSEFDVANKPAVLNTAYARGMSYGVAEDGSLDLTSGKPSGSVTASVKNGKVEDLDKSESIFRGEVKGGTKVTFEAKAAAGQKFVGWFAAGATEALSTEPTLTVAVDANYAVEARFVADGENPVPPTPAPDPEGKTFTVVFDDGIDATENASVEVKDGAKVAKPTDPVRDGYVFDGWMLDGKAYDFDAAVTGDMTLTAKWSLKAAELDPADPIEKPGTGEQGSNGTPGTTAPGKPGGSKPAPGKPGGETLVHTGDASLVTAAAVAGSGVLAAIVGAFSKRRRK